MADAEKIALIFHNDGGDSLLSEIDEDEYPGIKEALKAYISVVRESLLSLCSHRDFKHVTLQEAGDELKHEDATSSLCIAVGTAELGPDGQLQQVVNIRSPLDLQALLAAKAEIKGPLGTKVVCDEDGVLQIADEQLDKKVDRLLKVVKPAERMQAALTEEQEQVLVEALASLAPALEEGADESTLLEPVHPGDMLTLLVAYVAEMLGEAPRQASGPNPVGSAIALVRGVLGGARRRVRSMRKVVWRLEDIAVAGARLTARVARRAFRPLLVGLIVNRALHTLEDARAPWLRLARMTPAEQIEDQMTRLMGKDWRQQMEGDFLDAAKEVQDGYITDDYRAEKRKMSAAMLRELEVEDWDKERMRHFYYGSYGMGPWYLDMEERLHNPYFIGSRAWNGPIEGWVGKNKTYGDIPAGNVDWRSAALDVLEAKRGRALTREQRERITQRAGASNTDLLLSNEVLAKMVGKRKLQEALA